MYNWDRILKNGKELDLDDTGEQHIRSNLSVPPLSW